MFARALAPLCRTSCCSVCSCRPLRAPLLRRVLAAVEQPAADRCTSPEPADALAALRRELVDSSAAAALPAGAGARVTSAWTPRALPILAGADPACLCCLPRQAPPPAAATGGLPATQGLAQRCLRRTQSRGLALSPAACRPTKRTPSPPGLRSTRTEEGPRKIIRIQSQDQHETTRIKNPSEHRGMRPPFLDSIQYK